MSLGKAAPDPVEIAGRYQVIKKLGAGAFGTVYKAKDKILGRMVAIKTIRMEGLAAAATDLSELMDRFKREAQVSAQLKHPNIVTIYDIGDSDGMSYIAMEFIDGVGLDRVVVQAGRLPLERAALLGAQVADALDFAHKNSVVHRDIKPANIMIEAGDRVKVTDFGIAKVTDSADHLTATGSLLGTPSYMSPEQARGTAIDGRSDLFSVGCILYEMLAGKKAFRGDSITGLIFKIITEDPPPLREMDVEAPDEMVRIVAKALSKAPDARYQTGRELADDLLALTRAGTTPTMREAETPTSKSSPSLAPLPAMSGVAPTIVGPSTLNTPLTVHGSDPTRLAPPPPPALAVPPARTAAPPPIPRAAVGPKPKAASSNTGLLLGVAAAGFVFLLAVGGIGWYVFKGRDKVATSGPGGTVRTTGITQPPATSPPATQGSTNDQPPATTGEQPPAGSDEPPLRVTPPPVTQPPVSRDPGRTADARPPVTTPRSTPPDAGGGSSEFTFLDEEIAEGDGRATGQRLADTYRSKQGSSGGGNFGSSGRFRPRERSPRSLAPVERPAVATLRYIIDREEAFHRKEGRYGSFADLSRGGFVLDVPVTGNAFTRRGYKFELTVESNGFQIMAMPVGPGPRPFMGDDSGFIRAGTE